MARVLINREICRHTCTQGEFHVEIKAETKAIHLQAKNAKDCCHHQKRERHGTNFSSVPSESCQHPDLKTSGPQNYDTKHFYCLSPQLQYLIMATLGNYYNIQAHMYKFIYTGFNLKIAWYLHFKM